MRPICFNAPLIYLLRCVKQRIDTLVVCRQRGSAELFGNEFRQRLAREAGFARSRYIRDRRVEPCRVLARLPVIREEAGRAMKFGPTRPTIISV